MTPSSGRGCAPRWRPCGCGRSTCPAAAGDADAVLAEARRLGDPVATTAALNVTSRLAAFRADVTAAVAAGEEAVRVAAACPAASRTAPHLYLGLALLNADRLAAARDVLGEGRRDAELTGAAWALPKYESTLGLVAFFAGDWDDAVLHGVVNDLVAADTGHGTGHGQLRRDRRARRAVPRRPGARRRLRRRGDASARPTGGRRQRGLPYVRWLEASSPRPTVTTSAACTSCTACATSRCASACRSSCCGWRRTSPALRRRAGD